MSRTVVLFNINLIKGFKNMTNNEINTILHDKGFDNHGDNVKANLKDYLQDMADEYDLTLSQVVGMARILGVDELFDGLVSSCQDFEGGF